MDGLRRLAGIVPSIELNGKSYRVRPHTLGHRAEIEGYIVGQRGNIMEEIALRLDSIPVKHHDKILDAVMRRVEQKCIASQQEVIDFLSTFEGGAYLFWLAVRDEQPEINSHQAAMEIVRGVPLKEISEKLFHYLGGRDVGNLSGSPEAGETSQTESKTGFHGQSSTNDSPPNTDGSQSKSTD